jgi:hypothetical protein
VDRLPTGTVSSSTQISSVLVNSASYAATASLALGVSGSLAVNTDGLNEGVINLYYTDARVKTKLNAENVHSASFLGTATTTNLTEGINLYFTNQRVKDALPGVVSSSTQIPTVLPGGTVSSSAQYPGWVTASSQIDYNSIQNKLSGVVSSSQQIQPLLPANTVSSSVQVQVFLPGGTVSSSAQYPGWVTASSQIDYNSITNKLSGVVSSSGQVQPLLPGGTVSSSAQYPGWVTSSAQATGWTVLSASFASTASYISGNVLFNNGLDITGSLLVLGNISASSFTGSILSPGVVSSSAQYPGWVTSSAQIDYNSIQNKLSGVVSSSTQVQPLLPAGTVSSSGQVTITSTAGYSTFSSSIATKNDVQDVSINALNVATSSYAINATIQSQLASVVSSSTQVQPLLPNGTVSSSAQYPGWVTASSQIDYNSITNKLSGVYSSSAFSAPSQGTARLTLNGAALTDVDLGLQADDRPLFSGSQFSGIVSGSGLQYRLVVPVGTNFYAT